MGKLNNLKGKSLIVMVMSLWMMIESDLSRWRLALTSTTTVRKSIRWRLTDSFRRRRRRGNSSSSSSDSRKKMSLRRRNFRTMISEKPLPPRRRQLLSLSQRATMTMMEVSS